MKNRINLTTAQSDIIRDALVSAGISHRAAMRESIELGHVAMAGFYATLVARNERAEHIAWGMDDYFPADDCKAEVL